MIQLTNVHLQLKGRQLMAGLDWQLADPGAYLLLGATGSGKSLLARMLAGRLKPQRGSVTIDGAPMYRYFGGFNQALFFAQAEVACREAEPLEIYLASELANAGESPRVLERIWPVLERCWEGPRSRPLSEMSHGQVLLAQVGLACVIPVRLAVLDGHLTYLDRRFSQAAAEMIEYINQDQDKFLVLTAARLAAYFPSTRARFLLAGGMPLSMSELGDDTLIDTALETVATMGAIRLYTAQAPAQRTGITSGQHFKLLAVLEDGLSIQLNGSLDAALAELHAQGLQAQRLEWEKPKPD